MKRDWPTGKSKDFDKWFTATAIPVFNDQRWSKELPHDVDNLEAWFRNNQGAEGRSAWGVVVDELRACAGKEQMAMDGITLVNERGIPKTDHLKEVLGLMGGVYPVGLIFEREEGIGQSERVTLSRRCALNMGSYQDLDQKAIESFDDEDQEMICVGVVEQIPASSVPKLTLNQVSAAAAKQVRPT